MSMVLQINPNDDSPMNSARWVPATEAEKAKMGPDRPFFSEEGLTFADVLDIVNPLQHLPIIGPIYREITGDTISPGARLMGGTIFGGPLGLVGAAFELGVEQEFGRDPGGMLLAAVSGEEIAPAYNKTANLIGEVIPGETPAAGTPTGDLASAAGVQVEPLAPPTSAAVLPAAAALPATVTPPASGGIAYNSARAPISLTAGLIQAHTAPVGTAAGQAVPPVSAAVAAPATPLPATGQPIALAPTVSTSAPIGQPVAAPASPAGNAAAAASGISLPPGSTGLLTSSGLPSAGSITPALTMLQTQAAGAGQAAGAQAQAADPTGKLSGNAGVAAYQATREAPAVHPTAGQPAQPVVADAAAAGGQRWFELPTNRAPVNTGARVPPVLNRADVKTSQAATAQLAGDVAPAQVLNPITPTAAGAQPAVVSDAMKSALDKYDALLKSRQAGGGLNRTF